MRNVIIIPSICNIDLGSPGTEATIHSVLCGHTHCHAHCHMRPLPHPLPRPLPHPLSHAPIATPISTPTPKPIATPILYNVKVLILLCYLSVADSLQKWLTHSRARHRLMTSPRSFTRPRSILKCVLSLSVRVLLFMLLVVAGDVERNPGPQGKEGTTCIVWCI